MKIEICSPEGLKASEVKAIKAIGENFRDSWRGYASFLVNDGQGSMEIDLLVVTHDRFILCEIKEWAGNIHSNGQQWTQIFNDTQTRSHPSPVYIKRQHAQRLASIFKNELKPMWGGFYRVDYAIILAGTGTIALLPDSEKKVVFTLDEFLKINDVAEIYTNRFPTRNEEEWLFKTKKLKRPNEESQLRIFEKWFKGDKSIRPRYRLAEGFMVPAAKEAIFKHPKNFYIEFDARHHEQERLEALLRCWDFRQLGAYGMTQASRANVALRERRLIEYVSTEAPQVQKDYLMSPKHSAQDGEVDEDFIEVFQHSPLTKRLDMHINGLDSPDEKISLMRGLLTPFVELHKLGIAHRDISLERLWFDEYSGAILVSGLVSARFPENIPMMSVRDIREFIASNTIPVPEEILKLDDENIDPFRMDVYQLGSVMYRIAFGEDIKTDETSLKWHPPKKDPFNGRLNGWIIKAIDLEPSKRYASAQEMMEEFAKICAVDHSANDGGEAIMRELAEFYKPNLSPFLNWPPIPESFKNMEGRQSYLCKIDDIKYTLKLWPTLSPKPGEDAQNRKIYNFLERCQRAKRSQLNLVSPVDFGISGNGLYMMTPFVEGKTLEQYIQELPKDDTGIEKRITISQKLVASIKRLHESDLSHGDLKPDNIIVTIDGDEADILLVDLFDIDQSGNRIYNTDYSPKSHHSSFGNDIYATYCIVDELFSQCGGYAKTIREEIRRAIGANSQEVPVSLTPLQETLIHPCNSDDESIEDIILYEGKTSTGKINIESYSGDYYVSKDDRDPENCKIYITGAHEKIAVFYEYYDETPKIKFINLKPISPSELIHETRKSRIKKLRCNLIWNTGHGDNSDFFNKILGLFDDEDINRMKFEDDSDQTENGHNPLGSIWKHLHKEEFERYPKVTVLDYEELTGNTISVDIEEDIDHFEIDRNDIIEITDGDPDHPLRFGELDLSRSHANKLVIKKSGSKKIHKNNILQLRDKLSDISWRRRKKALFRILDRESLIPDLLSLFEKGDPDSRQKICNLPEPPSKLWDIYGKYLDESKKQAFRHILSGQLNVIMGPPGTGKTTLLSVLLDYLLRLPEVGRILLVSQSHIAVNEVAERARNVMREVNNALGEETININHLMTRLGEREKVSDHLLDIHVDALQSQYRIAFMRELENRMAALTKRLMLPADLILEASSMYRNLGSELYQYSHIDFNKSQDYANDDIMARKKQRLRNSLHNKFLEYTDDPEAIFAAPDMQLALLNCLASRHRINNPNQISKLNSVLAITHQWYQRLSADSDSFAGFMARTRKVVIGTLVGIGKTSYDIANHRYDIAIIDEAARASASELAVAMQSARRVILVGDHKQLMPHYDMGVIGDVARKLKVNPHEVAKTDFERAFEKNDGIMLDSQYRMQEPICEMISEIFYGGNLKTAIPSEACISVKTPWDSAVCWIDTSQLCIEEQSINSSKANNMEIDIICQQLKALIDDVDAMSILKKWSENGTKLPIGIITGYSQQVKNLRTRLDNESWAAPIREMIRIDTIDSYQGSENRIIILSLVRDNARKKAGFMNDESRINVALSRAKNHLLIVGASKMWKGSRSALGRIYNYIRERTEGSVNGYRIINLQNQSES